MSRKEICIFDNASWPKGKWELNYIDNKDWYEIKTEYGLLIGYIGPTLVAHFLVKINNLFWAD